MQFEMLSFILAIFLLICGLHGRKCISHCFPGDGFSPTRHQSCPRRYTTLGRIWCISPGKPCEMHIIRELLCSLLLVLQQLDICQVVAIPITKLIFIHVLHIILLISRRDPHCGWRYNLQWPCSVICQIGCFEKQVGWTKLLRVDVQEGMIEMFLYTKNRNTDRVWLYFYDSIILIQFIIVTTRLQI